MASMPYSLELPNILKRTTTPIKCKRCAVSHLTRKTNTGKVQLLNPGQIIGTDIGGPLPKTAHGQAYLMTVTEHHAICKLIYLLQTKGEAEHCLLAAIESVDEAF